jgi:tryptophanyl-tRNA synthetase
MKQRLFSGIQPTGNLHIGNYIGAISQWVKLQETHESVFCIVDMHAITVRQDPDALRRATRELAALYIACGIDPAKSILFVQSDVSAHTQLGWILNTFAYMGEMERMTQFKDKKEAQDSNNNVGLFSYPVLMAADILLYDTAVVPVGEDQKQHVELTRDLAQRVNSHYQTELFVVPEPMIKSDGARIMGLDDATKKMSKSASSQWNYISFSDTPDLIRKKIMKAVTDSDETFAVRAGADKPELTNLLTIYSELTGRSIADLTEQFAGQQYGAFKKQMAEDVVAWMIPIQTRMHELLADEKSLDRILDAGADRAAEIAIAKLEDVRTVVGLGK